MRMRRAAALMATAMLAGALSLAAGCGKTNNDGANNGLKAQGMANNDYMSARSVHPRLPGHHAVTNYSADNVSMKRAIKNLRGVADSNITFNGADAYVTIKLAPGLRPHEIPTLEQQVATVLRFNYPRYTIHVTSMK
ncbi:hypothetical protein ACFPPD_01335 [Cohnella suwonensis]|uniref:Sporulation protein n=1 Tax=Cohnella suwonensis TaxID=696072 RepID=A0ABW0LN72_9BACL